jgi:hypothetical protein
MPQTLVSPNPAGGRFDVSEQAVVRSWKDCGSDVAWVQVVGELAVFAAPTLEQWLRDAELEIADLDRGEPVAHVLSHLARRDQAA